MKFVLLFLFPVLCFSQFKHGQTEVTAVTEKDYHYVITNPDSTVIVLAGKIERGNNINNWTVELKNQNFKTLKSISIVSKASLDVSYNKLMSQANSHLRVLKRGAWIYLVLMNGKEGIVQTFQINRKTLAIKDLIHEGNMYLSGAFIYDEVLVIGQTVMFSFNETLSKNLTLKKNFTDGTIIKDRYLAVTGELILWSLSEIPNINNEIEEYVGVYGVVGSNTALNTYKIFNANHQVIKEFKAEIGTTNLKICKNINNEFLTFTMQSDGMRIGKIVNNICSDIRTFKLDQDKENPRMTRIGDFAWETRYLGAAMRLVSISRLGNNWVAAANYRAVYESMGKASHTILYGISDQGEIKWFFNNVFYNEKDGGFYIPWKNGLPPADIIPLKNNNLYMGVHATDNVVKNLILNIDGRVLSEESLKITEDDKFKIRELNESLGTQYWYGNTILLHGTLNFSAKKPADKDGNGPKFILQKITF